MTLRVAQGLVIAGLVLLIIYGADAAVGGGEAGVGFLPLDAVTRGIGFGGGAVALSTAAFFVSMGKRSTLVSALLIVNGALIIIGGVLPILGGSIGLGAPVLGMGIWVLASGIIKGARARAVKQV